MLSLSRDSASEEKHVTDVQDPSEMLTAKQSADGEAAGLLRHSLFQRESLAYLIRNNVPKAKKK